MNLLSSKDPLAFQQVQTVSVEPDTGYNGPILSGDEIEAMESQLNEMDRLWNRASDTD
jgi:HAMP domain-containing protein